MSNPSISRVAHPSWKTWLVVSLLAVAACNSSNRSAAPGVASEPTVGSADVLPGVVVTIEAVRGRAGVGRGDIGDRLSVDFSVRTSSGQPLELSKLARGAIMVSGPTSNYQRVIASQSDVLARARKRDLGLYTYDFTAPIPATYLPPLNDTTALTEGELTGSALVAGTYTVGLELRKDYTIDGVTYRDPGNTTADFLLGGATALEPREVVTLAHCNQCHTELRAHGDNRNNIGNCLLCHTAGAEDKNVASAAGGTPGVAIDFKVMIHKIHSGKHLPSVLGVTTNPDGTRKYDATPRPYQLVGFGDAVVDFSTITWPAWPSFYTPMPADTGYGSLSSTLQSRERTMRQGPAECGKCHGDPDGVGPIEAPKQGDLIWAQPTIAACASCHDDWVPAHPYTANGQTMPVQQDNAACKQCHRVEGTALDVKDAHRHPLVDPSVASGVNFVVESVTDVGGTANGRFEAGERVEIRFRIENDAGAAINASTLNRFEAILTGPADNPQMVSYQRVAQNFFTGAGPYTFRLPEQVYYESIGTSAAGANPFTTSRAPLWNVTNAATSLLRVTGTSTTTTLVAPAEPAQNYLDVLSSTGFAKDDMIVIDDGFPDFREFMKIQYVEGNRLWFGSVYRQTYKPNLRKAHGVGAEVVEVSVETVPPAWYSVATATGVITEGTEFGVGEILASYTTDFVVPGVYPGALGDSPVNGQDWGDFTGLPLLDGTYVLDLHGSRQIPVVRSGETTTYTEGANSTGTQLLFGMATTIETISRIDPAACYGCHDSLQFHGGSRRSVEACLSCHGTAGAEGALKYENAATGGFGFSIEFRNLLHTLHQPVFPGMPGGVQDCAKCHGANTAWQVPDERSHPGQTLPTRAWRAACTSCHSGSAAVAHVDANTSPSGAEACSVCHGATDPLSVFEVHKVK